MLTGGAQHAGRSEQAQRDADSQAERQEPLKASAKLSGSTMQNQPERGCPRTPRTTEEESMKAIQEVSDQEWLSRSREFGKQFQHGEAPTAEEYLAFAREAIQHDVDVS